VGRALASVIGLVLAGGFVAGSGVMNFAFLSREAEHANEGLVLGAIAIGVTGYNALGPLFVGWAWENGRTWFVAPAAALMWVVFVGFSLMCAVGFTASNRGAVTGARAAETARLESAEDHLRKTKSSLAALAQPRRTASVVEETLNGARQALATLSRRAVRVLDAYLEKLGAAPVGVSPIFRNRSGVPYSKDTLGDDFRAVRRAVFGEAERRQLQDFRRSGTVEALAGKVVPTDLSSKMANSISQSSRLQKTYGPVQLAAVRDADEARRRGRSRLRGQRAAGSAMAEQSGAKIPTAAGQDSNNSVQQPAKALK
jgi:hypothetical protein